MLNLASATDPRWVEQALAHLDDVLLDHAHCERKAAGMAVRLMFRYPDRAFLHEPLSRLAREELTHYEQVLRVLGERGLTVRRQRAGPYGGKLSRLIRDREPDRLADTLLVNALIEARSCERFKLLAEAVDDTRLAALYRGLLASEARHHHVYGDLATELVGAEPARARLAELSAREAAIVAEPAAEVRMHSQALA